MTVGGAAVTFGPAAVLVVLSREGHFDNCPLAHQFLIDCGESRSRAIAPAYPLRFSEEIRLGSLGLTEFRTTKEKE